VVEHTDGQFGFISSPIGYVLFDATQHSGQDRVVGTLVSGQFFFRP
jgi:hypothetical protein